MEEQTHTNGDDFLDKVKGVRKILNGCSVDQVKEICRLTILHFELTPTIIERS